MDRCPNPIRSLAVLALLIAAAAASRLDAQSGDAAAADDPRAGRLREMTRMAREIRVFRQEAGEAAQVELIAEPLLRFSDPAREFSDGTLWAYGAAGRPEVLVTVERYPEFWSWELVSLSTAAGTSAVTAEGWRWSPRQPGLEFQPFPDAPPAAAAPTGRLTQMRALARRFRLSETLPDGQKYELRLMPQPVHRYSDPESGLADGALFVYSYGTNPEAVAVIECRREQGAAASWWFAFAPLTSAEPSAVLDGREVWTKPPVRLPRLHEPYTYYSDEFEEP